MKVLIATINKDIVKEFFPRKKFVYATENTCFFQCTEKKFMEFRKFIRAKGINPYAFMSW